MDCGLSTKPESVCNASSSGAQTVVRSVTDLLNTTHQTETSKKLLTSNCLKIKNNGCSLDNSTTSAVPMCSNAVQCAVLKLEVLPRQNSILSPNTSKINFFNEDVKSFSSVSCKNIPSNIECATATAAVNVADICNSATSNICGNQSYETPLQHLKVVTSHDKGNNVHSTSKEEKQRQNAERVIMEISSNSADVSSTVTNLTSVQPVQFSDVDLQSCCVQFLQNERKLPQQTEIGNLKDRDAELDIPEECNFEPGNSRSCKKFSCPTVSCETSSQLTDSSSSFIVHGKEKEENPPTNLGTNACFIDASSLCDEDEVLSFPSMDGQNSNDCFDGHEEDIEKAFVRTANDDSITKNLETFHKEFTKCKLKSSKLTEDNLREILSKSSSSSNSAADSPQNSSKASKSSTNNLSDEEKLWKRQHENHSALVKDIVNEQYDNSYHESKNQKLLSDDNNTTEDSVSLVMNLCSSESSNFTKNGDGQEYKQNACLFQTNFQPCNIHPLRKDAISAHYVAHSAQVLPNVALNSDLSYSTEYSSSIPVPSLVWSEHEHQPSSTVSNYNNEYIRKTQKPTLMPETPHNSIVNFDNASSLYRENNSSSLLSHQRDSGAYCSDAIESSVLMPRTAKTSKCDEESTILFGEVSIKDWNVRQFDRIVKREKNPYPMVEGGSISVGCESPQSDIKKLELESTEEPKILEPGFTSWVVDMSDCRLEGRKSTSLTSSIETSSNHQRLAHSTSSRISSCGFYVSLNDIDQNVDGHSINKENKKFSNPYTSSKSCAFYANLANNDYQTTKSETDKLRHEKTAEASSLFSMFIEIGDKNLVNKRKEEPDNLAHRFTNLSRSQRKSVDILKSSPSSTETRMPKSSTFNVVVEDEKNKCLDYKYKMNRPLTVAAIQRISEQGGQSEGAKRHSWCSNHSKDSVFHNYQRSISLMANDKQSGNNGLMSIIDKLPILYHPTFFSDESSVTPCNENMGSKSELSTSSTESTHNFSDGERVYSYDSSNIKGLCLKKRRRDVDINETFDKSSVTSLTDNMISKDLSPVSTTDTEELTFQQDEESALRDAVLHEQLPLVQIQSNRSNANIMETIIETKEISSPKKNINEHTMETLHATIEKQKQLLDTVSEHHVVTKSSFVKLSDMDKPIRFDLHSPEAIMSASVDNHRKINCISRDESKARPHSWAMTRSTGNSFLNFTNSKDNFRSLSRLFPNFTNGSTYSLPNDMKLEQMDYLQTDISADSSLTSSFSPSGIDESTISCRQPRRLGEDLLKMFLQEIATDMIVEVHGRRIRAHKCILRSRCQYFAGMLAGNGAENVVTLQGYSYSAVHFALCHIYSGASHPPDGISLMELAALADLLGLEGLKEVTAHVLKINYCHNFHKPCTGCIDGILQVLPVALNHALDDLYRKCLRWTCRYYLKVWPTRQFAQLTVDIMERCRQQIVAYLTSESVLDTVLDCDHLLAQLASFSFGAVCENLVRDILEESYDYIANHFASLVASDSFLSLGHDRSCHISRLEEVLLRTASSLTPDQACRSYQRITRLNTVLMAKVTQIQSEVGDLSKELQGLQAENLDWDPEYIRLVNVILSTVEQCMIRQCSRAMRVTAWQRMDLELRKKIQMLARITEPLETKRNNSVSKALTFSCSSRKRDLYQVKLAMQAHSRRSLAQDTQLYKATQTQVADNVQKSQHSGHDPKDGNSQILKSNTRVHVPRSLVNYNNPFTKITTASEPCSVNIHRRTKSEAPISSTEVVTRMAEKSTNLKLDRVKKTKPEQRLTDVRPRYLQPRKVHTLLDVHIYGGAVRNGTSSRIQMSKNRGLHIASSDSSRNSSPVACKSREYGNKTPTKFTNMSQVRLASPLRSKYVHARVSGNDRFSEKGADSLNESMKTSIKINKTVSQDSLLSSTPVSCVNPMTTGNYNYNVPHINSAQSTKLNSGVLNRRTTATTNKVKKDSVQQHNKSTGSSPSSINTTKSTACRISTHSSTYSSRDIYKQRSLSIPVKANGISQNASGKAKVESQRHSFLSAKSREILANRAKNSKYNQTQQEHHLQTYSLGKGMEVWRPIHLASNSDISTSSVSVTAKHTQSPLPSNIPTRRPNAVQLKNTISEGSKKRFLNEALNYQSKVGNTNNDIQKAAVKQKIDIGIDLSIASSTIISSILVESKLERSSTFCKDISEI